MKRRFSSEQKAMMVARYREGERLKNIASDFGCSTGVITDIVHRAGEPNRIIRGINGSAPRKVKQWHYRSNLAAARYVNAWLEPHACPTCGRTLPKDHLAIGSNIVSLRGKQRILYDAVLKAGDNGINRDRLMELIYGGDVNGGPDSLNILNVIIYNVNKKLKVTNKYIHSTGLGPGERFYVLGDL